MSRGELKELIFSKDYELDQCKCSNYFALEERPMGFMSMRASNRLSLTDTKRQQNIHTKTEQKNLFNIFKNTLKHSVLKIYSMSLSSQLFLKGKWENYSFRQYHNCRPLIAFLSVVTILPRSVGLPRPVSTGKETG